MHYEQSNNDIAPQQQLDTEVGITCVHEFEERYYIYNTSNSNMVNSALEQKIKSMSHYWKTDFGDKICIKN